MVGRWGMKIDAMRMPSRLIFRCLAIKKLASMFYQQQAIERKRQKNNAWRKVMRRPKRRRGPIIFYGLNTVSR